MSNKRLKGKIAVITGAATGIGQGIAILFAQHGCHLILLDINHCNDTISKIDTKLHDNKNIISFKCDISNENEIKNIINELRYNKDYNRFNKINIIVNNACKYYYKSVLSATNDDWDNTLKINIKGHCLITKHFVPLLLHDGTSSIINIGSIQSFMGKPNAITYGVCKAAIVQMTKNMAIDLGRELYKIRVNCVCPGGVNTFNGSTLSANKYKNNDINTMSQQEWLSICNKPGIIKRKATVKEIAFSVLFFASNESSFCTGSILCCDGGTSCL